MASKYEVANRPTLICEHCGDSFRVAPSHVRNSINGSPRRFCSRICRYAAMRGANGANAGGGEWMRGEANPLWKGGVTQANKDRSPFHAEMYQWRRRVFDRDAYTCQRCGLYPKVKNQLRAHHIAPWALHPDKRFDVENGVTLCHTCHTWVHSNANAEREYLA